MEEAINATDPQNLAAFFIICYPEYGSSHGGRLVHDPVFVAYFTPSSAIPEFQLELIVVIISIGIIMVFVSQNKWKKFKIKN